MTNSQLAALTHSLLEVSRQYLIRAKPLGDSDNYICNMTTSMVLAAIADAIIDFQHREIVKDDRALMDELEYEGERE